MEKTNKGPSQADIMLYLVNQNATLFHTPDGEAYANIIDEGIQKNLSLRSEEFETWLTYLYFIKTQKPIGTSFLKTALRTLYSIAKYHGPEVEVNLRYAYHSGCIYIDLGNKKWEQIQISPGGYKVISGSESPVKFRRDRSMSAMPYPAEKGSLEPLRDILNINSDSDFKLLIGWLIGAITPTGPFPILVLTGEQGTSKSMTTRILKDLIDPSMCATLALPKSERDLAIAANNSWLLPYDNLSSLSGNISDFFCRLSTGGGFRTRSLFTNGQETVFNSIRPIIMNGITDFVTRQDLTDRAIIINLDPIPQNRRMTEKQIKAQWEETKPFVFAALCDALAMSLKNSGSVNLRESPRMADFVHTVTAAEPALGWKNGEFFEVYMENINKVVDIALESDEVAKAVMLMMRQKDEWTGTATELRATLENFVDDSVRRSRSWPKLVNGLSNRLKRCGTYLRSKGIEIERGKSGNRYITIQKIQPNQQALLTWGPGYDSFCHLETIISKENIFQARDNTIF